MGLSGCITPWRRENGQALGNHALIQIMIKIFEHKIYREMRENSESIGHSEQIL